MKTYHELKIIHRLDNTWYSALKNGTAIYIQPETKKVLKAITDSFKTDLNPQIKLKVGVAICHSKDQFSRKIGRELAEKDLEERTFEIQLKTDQISDYHLIKFVSVIKGHRVELLARLYKDSKKLRIYSLNISVAK
jgi:hypothetical protein